MYSEIIPDVSVPFILARQDAKPSSEDDRKRMDLLDRLRNLVGEGLLGFTGLTIEVRVCVLTVCTVCIWQRYLAEVN